MKSKANRRRETSLLSRHLWQFAVCTIACFVLTAPLFYLLTKYFYAEDLIDLMEAIERGQGIPSIDLERDIIAGMMLQFLLIFVVISLSMFVTMRMATKKLWRPFDDTLRKTEQFNLAQGEIPHFEDTDISEFSRLNQSVERLMRKDTETYRIQKEFTENASHELQTPIAILRGKLDVLMQGHLDEDQMQIVSDLYGLTVRMGYLNRNLLLLAKIDNAQYSVSDSVDVVALLSSSLPLYGVLQEGIYVQLVDHRKDKNKRLLANSILTECLLKNLVVNAIRHTDKGGTIRVIVEDGRLVVSNPSTDGIPLDAERLFQRFRSVGDRRDGNGLGLAIVKAICDYHHWSMAYSFEPPYHQFIVNFN